MSLDGLQLGHYRLLHLIGSGAMGDVYLAEDTRIPRQVAIKVIRSEVTAYPDANATQEAVRLFQREMRTITMLDHPHILPLYDFGEESVNRASLAYMVTPYRPEGSLADWLQQRGSADLLSPQDAGYLLQQAASALQHAHHRQIIHQDVKPSNFLIHSNEEDPSHPDLLLADFGVAKFLSATSNMSHSTRGTPTYMAPEQWSGEPVPATDQYALAVMAYELLTGRPPFQGRQEQVMYQHFNVQPQPPSKLNPNISGDTDRVLLIALAKKPEDRFASISAFAHTFQQAVLSAPAASPVQARPAISESDNDIRTTLAISKMEALSGTSRTLTLPGGQHATVSVPAGAYDGQVIRLEGLGKPTQSGEQAGTLILTLAIDQTEEPDLTALSGSTAPTILAAKPDLQVPTVPTPRPATEEPKSSTPRSDSSQKKAFTPQANTTPDVPTSKPKSAKSKPPTSRGNKTTPSPASTSTDDKVASKPPEPVKDEKIATKPPEPTKADKAVPKPSNPIKDDKVASKPPEPIKADKVVAKPPELIKDDKAIPTLPISPALDIATPQPSRSSRPSTGQILQGIVGVLFLIGISVYLFSMWRNDQIATDNRHATATTRFTIIDQTNSVFNTRIAATVSAATAQANNAAATAQVNATSFAQNGNPYPPHTGTLSLYDPLNGFGTDYTWTTGCQGTFTDGALQTEATIGFPDECYSNSGADFSNFTAQVQVTITKGDCGGIEFRANANGSTYAYVFIICSDGSYYLADTQADGYLVKTSSSAIQRGLNATNVIGVVANGSSITVYANHQQLAQVHDSTYSKGYFALVAESPNNLTDVVFKDLLVWT